MACAVHGVPRGILRLAQFFTSRYARSPEVADIATRVAGDGQQKALNSSLVRGMIACPSTAAAPRPLRDVD